MLVVEPAWKRLLYHNAPRVRAFETNVLPRIVARKPARFLEVGCGSGYASALVKAALPDCYVVASDADAKTLRDYAVPTAEFMHGTPDEITVADLAALPHDWRWRFDIVYSAMVLYQAHVPTGDSDYGEPEYPWSPVRRVLCAGITRVLNVLGSGGLWIGIEPSAPWCEPWRSRYARVLAGRNGGERAVVAWLWRHALARLVVPLGGSVETSVRLVPGRRVRHQELRNLLNAVKPLRVEMTVERA